MSLTPKMEKFCQCIVSGMSGKDSYITAYNNKSNDNTAYKESMKLLVRSDIQDRIKELNKPLEIQAQSKALSARDKQIKAIEDRIEVCISNNDETSLIRYYDMLNKIYNLYKDQEDTKKEENTFDNIDTNTLLKLVK